MKEKLQTLLRETKETQNTWQT